MYIKNRDTLMKDRWTPSRYILDFERDKQYKEIDRRLRIFFPNVDKMSRKTKNERWRSIKGPRVVYNYDPRVENGHVALNETKVKFPWSVKVGKNSSRLPKEITDRLPIKTSRVCKWVGQTPFPIGFQPQKIHDGDANFWEFIADKKYGDKWEKYVKGDNLDMKMIGGSWPTNCIDIKKAGEDVKCGLNYDYLFESLHKRRHKLKLPKIDYIPQKEMLWSTEISPGTFPGIISSKLFGSTKKIAFKGSVMVAERMFEMAASRPLQDTSLWSVGGRERPQKMSEEGKEVRSRAVWMPEMPSSQISQLYSRPIQKQLQVMQKEMENIELMCGFSFYGRGWDKFSKRFGKYTNVMFADWSRHDQTVKEETIVLAFSILRNCYPSSRQIDNHFLFIMSGFIHKHVAIPGRFIYLISKGIPSGSPFTTLITTLCCWLEWSYIFNKCGIGDTDLAVYGDDTIAGLDINDRFPDDIQKKIKEWIGMDVDPFEISTFTSDTNRHLNANFLQTYDYNGLPGRNLETVIRLLALPKKQCKGDYDKSYKITGTIYTGPGNWKASELICEFRDWLRWRTLKHERERKEKHPIKNFVGVIAMRISMRVALINYLKTPCKWIDKDIGSLWWLNKESYSPDDCELNKIIRLRSKAFGL